MTKISRMNHAQLDAYVAEIDVMPGGWSDMKVDQKRTWLQQCRLHEFTAETTAPALEDAPKDTITIKIIDASSNPVHLYVHGTGYWSIRIGETVTLPVDAVSALRNSDVKFDEAN